MNPIRKLVIFGMASLLMPSSLPAGVQAVWTDATSKIALEQGLRTCQVAVNFDYPDEDILLSVGFADVSITDKAGFYQFPPAMGGGNTAPLEVFLGLFPELIADSFVTIQKTTVAIGSGDCTTLDPQFDAAAFNNDGVIVGGWFCNNPPSGQGDPDESGQVVIMQLTMTEGQSAAGTLTVFYGGYGGKETYSDELSIACFGPVPCPTDLNGDEMVNPVDLAQFLGIRYNAQGQPQPGSPADFNGDTLINAADLALLLGSWGPCD